MRWIRALGMWAVVGCQGPGPGTDTDPVVLDTGDTELEEPLYTTDVVVIGSGPTGLSAAYAAEAAGRDVLLLERAPSPGGSGTYAGVLFGVDTRYQRARGIEDSVELAAGEWPTTSAGGDGQDPRVQLLFERSAETIEWIDDGLGVGIGDVVSELGTPGLPRSHLLPTGENGPTRKLIRMLDDRIVVDTEATDIVFDASGAAIGARIRDMQTGTEGWVRAGAVVVATGGFGRELDRVLQDRPELMGMELVIEIAYTSDGGGIGLMQRAGAVQQNAGAFGMYAHSMQDLRPGYEGEALWVGDLQSSLFLDGGGQRFVNEEEAFGFELAGIVAGLPGKRAWVVLPAPSFMSRDVLVPPYQGPLGSPETLDPQTLIDAGAVGVYATPEALGTALGMDPAVVKATFDRYESAVVSGVDADHGKPGAALRTFAGADLAVFELHLGAAKAFTGFSVDVDGRVVDGMGQVVPGLYAGGEVTGMLGTPGVGAGFSGSATACYLTGLVAGEQAAVWVAAAPAP